MTYDLATQHEAVVTIRVYSYDQDDGTTVYDWWAGEDEADELFETAEEALRDAMNHIGADRLLLE